MRKTVALFFALALPAHAALSRLEAISLIESGNNDRALGTAGEVSRYQLLPNVWSSYSDSHSYANPQVAGEVARQHLDHLEAWFQAHVGRAPTDFEIYVLWNAGPAYYARKSFSAGSVNRLVRERAERFVNLRGLGP